MQFVFPDSDILILGGQESSSVTDPLGSKRPNPEEQTLQITYYDILYANCISFCNCKVT